MTGGEHVIVAMVTLSVGSVIYLTYNWWRWITSLPGERREQFVQACRNTIMLTVTWVVVLSALHDPYTVGILADGPERVWWWFTRLLLAGVIAASSVIVLGSRLGVWFQKKFRSRQNQHGYED